jgi:hypothetical protein
MFISWSKLCTGKKEGVCGLLRNRLFNVIFRALFYAYIKHHPKVPEAPCWVQGLTGQTKPTKNAFHVGPPGLIRIRQQGKR